MWSKKKSRSGVHESPGPSDVPETQQAETTAREPSRILGGWSVGSLSMTSSRGTPGSPPRAPPSPSRASSSSRGGIGSPGRGKQKGQSRSEDPSVGDGSSATARSSSTPKSSERPMIESHRSTSPSPNEEPSSSSTPKLQSLVDITIEKEDQPDSPSIPDDSIEGTLVEKVFTTTPVLAEEPPAIWSVDQNQDPPETETPRVEIEVTDVEGQTHSQQKEEAVREGWSFTTESLVAESLAEDSIRGGSIDEAEGHEQAAQRTEIGAATPLSEGGSPILEAGSFKGGEIADSVENDGAFGSDAFEAEDSSFKSPQGGTDDGAEQPADFDGNHSKASTQRTFSSMSALLDSKEAETHSTSPRPETERSDMNLSRSQTDKSSQSHETTPRMNETILQSARQSHESATARSVMSQTITTDSPSQSNHLTEQVSHLCAMAGPVGSSYDSVAATNPWPHDPLASPNSQISISQYSIQSAMSSQSPQTLGDLFLSQAGFQTYGHQPDPPTTSHSSEIAPYMNLPELRAVTPIPEEPSVPADRVLDEMLGATAAADHQDSCEAERSTADCLAKTTEDMTERLPAEAEDPAEAVLGKKASGASNASRKSSMHVEYPPIPTSQNSEEPLGGVAVLEISPQLAVEAPPMDQPSKTASGNPSAMAEGSAQLIGNSLSSSDAHQPHVQCLLHSTFNLSYGALGDVNTMMASEDPFPFSLLTVRDKLTSTSDLMEDNWSLLIGLPTAMTPESTHIMAALKEQFQSGYLQAFHIYCLTMDTPPVINAWAKLMGVTDEIVFVSDSVGALCRKIGSLADFSTTGLGLRCRPFVAVIDPSAVVFAMSYELRIARILELARLTGMTPDRDLPSNGKLPPESSEDAAEQASKVDDLVGLRGADDGVLKPSFEESRSSESATAESEPSGSRSAFTEEVVETSESSGRPDSVAHGSSHADDQSEELEKLIVEETAAVYKPSDDVNSFLDAPAIMVVSAISQSFDTASESALPAVAPPTVTLAPDILAALESEIRGPEGSKNPAYVVKRSQCNLLYESESESSDLVSKEAGPVIDSLMERMAVETKHCQGRTLHDVGSFAGDELMDIKFGFSVPSEWDMTRRSKKGLSNAKWDLSISLNTPEAGYVIADKRKFYATQIHFHSPAVHALPGLDQQRRPLEMHVVCLPRSNNSPPDCVAVVCFTFIWEPEYEHRPCQVIESIISTALGRGFRSDGSKNVVDSFDVPIDLQGLIAQNTITAFYRYATMNTSHPSPVRYGCAQLSSCSAQSLEASPSVDGEMEDSVGALESHNGRVLWLVARDGIPLQWESIQCLRLILGHSTLQDPSTLSGSVNRLMAAASAMRRAEPSRQTGRPDAELLGDPLLRQPSLEYSLGQFPSAMYDISRPPGESMALKRAATLVHQGSAENEAAASTINSRVVLVVSSLVG